MKKCDEFRSEKVFFFNVCFFNCGNIKIIYLFFFFLFIFLLKKIFIKKKNNPQSIFKLVQFRTIKKKKNEFTLKKKRTFARNQTKMSEPTMSKLEDVTTNSNPIFEFPNPSINEAEQRQYYEKVRVYFNKPPVKFLADKPAFERIGSVGYLFDTDAKKKDTKDFDDSDKLFMESCDGYEKYEFFALHTYGGYYGFFRPDLREVIFLIHNQLKHSIDTIDHMYVTTEMYPSSNIQEVYDSKKDGHRAKTTVFVKLL